MPTYIALLRGINVGANKRMKMEKLRASCESLRFEAVKTYIQSGNIVFRATQLSPATLSKKFEECIQRDFGFSADVIARTLEQMKQIIERNPLLKEKDVDLVSAEGHIASGLAVSFCIREVPSPVQVLVPVGPELELIVMPAPAPVKCSPKLDVPVKSTKPPVICNLFR